eukprot:TRINITY_DN3295_c0_g1_i6.p2 TRINITY_DN3295_c0_g1~~TRINITY_DN3295_c0_g1_i6.p2  ORF type:complete len:205 (-),score=40.76 TRINITY_DN3295_c0_g1_i6:20-634(-)
MCQKHGDAFSTGFFKAWREMCREHPNFGAGTRERNEVPSEAAGASMGATRSQNGAELDRREMAGSIAASEWWLRVVKRSFAHTGWPMQVTEPVIDGGLFEWVWDEFASNRTWSLYDDAVPFLQEAKRRGLHVMVLSNNDERLDETLQSVGLRSLLDHVVVSRSERAEKPSKEIFEAALSRYSGIQVWHPNIECFFIVHIFWLVK